MLSLPVIGQSVIKKEKQLSTEIDNYIKVEIKKKSKIVVAKLFLAM